jgi:hypothetical protein
MAMTEFELLRSLINVGQAKRIIVGKALGLNLADLATEDGIKRQFKDLKAAGKLEDLERRLKEPTKP